MIIVLSLGGSIFGNVDKIRQFAKVIEEIECDKIFVVVGGGKIAREYINKARKLGADEAFCDYLGIEVTRLNAMLLISALKSIAKKVPKDFVEAYELSKTSRIVVMGGTFPGHTTDATAALLAEFVNADLLLNATSVNGVYSADPKKDKDAKRFEKLTPNELVEIVRKGEIKAGSSNVIDLLAAKIIERSGIRTIIFLGEPGNIKKVIEGDVKDIGTVIE
ncbi:UMP kinase [Archaeoglobales archaeon]|nr:MAG: UMP kinase [Archaeoglobales archaeon]